MIVKEKCLTCPQLYIEDLYNMAECRLCGAICSKNALENTQNKEENA